MSEGGGLNSPYKRIIFGISVADILQSLSLAVGPFVAPSTTPQGLWAIGNYGSCQAFGFLNSIGETATPLYMFTFCLHTMLRIRKNGRNEKFEKRLECPINVLIIVFILSTGIAGIATQTLNSTIFGTYCSHAAFPTGCRQLPDLFGECDEIIARRAFILINLVSVAVPLICLLGIITCMILTCAYILKRDRQIFGNRSLYAKESTKVVQMNTTNELLTETAKNNTKMPTIVSKSDPPIPSSTALRRSNIDVRKKAEFERKYLTRQILLQACWYVAAYFITYFWSTLIQVIALAGHEPPQSCIYFYAFTHPLGGVFNIFVYTRPKVYDLRKSYPGKHSYLNAFWLVIKGGFTSPASRRNIEALAQRQDFEQI